MTLFRYLRQYLYIIYSQITERLCKAKDSKITQRLEINAKIIAPKERAA